MRSDHVTVKADPAGERVQKDSTILRVIAERAVGELLSGLDYDPNKTGVVGFTQFGDRYPEKWLASGRRCRPHDFGSAILNSVAGHCANAFGLKGPQTAMVVGSPTVYAAHLLLEGRADMMVVLYYDSADEVRAEAFWTVP